MAIDSSPIGDDTLCRREAFQSALGGISKSTQIRYENSGQIPPPDGYMGRQPVWKRSTIKAAVERLLKTSAPSPAPMMRSPGRPRKEEKPKVGGCS